jgi:ParB family transcriptional regulator, chromosome partitioning protein
MREPRLVKDGGHLVAVFFVPRWRCAGGSINQQAKGVGMSLSRSTSNNAAQNAGQDAEQGFRELPIEVVLPNPSQPRRRFDEEALKELAGSIGERGVLQPVLVRPLQDGKYQLVAGERRWRAAKLVGLKSIPALVRAREDAEALEVGLIENMARKDLNILEEARTCTTLVQELGLTQREVGQRVGRTSNYVSNLVRLMSLPGEVLELLERGELSGSHGIVLLDVKDLEARRALARAAIAEGWSTAVLQHRVRESNVDVLKSQRDRGEQAQNPKQARELAALNVATAWGDLLGAEVHVRPVRQQMRMEVVFDFAAEGMALAERLASVVARGSKGK